MVKLCMERCANTTRQILTQECHSVTQMLAILKTVGHIVIGSCVLYDKVGCPIGSQTTLIRNSGVVREKIYLVVRVDVDDSQGTSLDVDYLNSAGKRDRNRQKDLGIAHHNYVKNTDKRMPSTTT